MIDPALAPPPPRRPRVWPLAVATVLAAVGAVAGSLAVGGVFVLQMIARFLRENGHAPAPAAVGRAVDAMAQTPAVLVGSGMASCLSFAFFALVPASLSAAGLADRLRLRAHRAWFAWGLVAGAGLLGIGLVSSGVLALLGLEGAGALGVITRALTHLDAPMAVTAVAVIGLGAGAGEELFFRGYLLTRLAERWRPWIAVAITAALFAAAHLDPLHSLFALAVGVFLGWVSLRTGSIRATLVAHALNNSVGVVAMAASSRVETTSPREAVAHLVAGLVVVAACTFAFARGRFEAPARA